MRMKRPNFQLKVAWNNKKSSLKQIINIKNEESSLKSISSGSSAAYLFAKERNPKWKQEKNIQDFLSSVGIFQINIGVAFEEF